MATPSDRLMYAEDVLDHAIRNRQPKRAALMEYAIVRYLRAEEQEQRREERMESVRKQLREAFSYFNPNRR